MPDVSSLAKQTLMEMALNKVAPTPENYAAFYAKNAAEAGAGADGGAGSNGRELAARAEASARSLRGVLGIVEAFMANLSAFFPDNPMLLEQLAIVRDALKAPEDLAKLSAAQKSLSRLSAPALHSHISALLNRRGLDEALASAYASAPTVSLALLDIDNFKALNDSLGHEAGDLALKRLSQAIGDILGSGARASRMGGEEFLLVFESLPPEEAKRQVEGLQRALTTKYFLEAEGSILITFSAGVASRRPGEQPSATIARADEAMYAAKRLGKNRVELAAP